MAFIIIIIIIIIAINMGVQELVPLNMTSLNAYIACVHMWWAVSQEGCDMLGVCKARTGHLPRHVKAMPGPQGPHHARLRPS